MNKQLSFDLNYGISHEQACILCHLSAECEGCCAKCNHPNGCQGQCCSQPSRERDGLRWDTWMYLLKTSLPELARFIAPELRKKYGINKLIRRK
jgi:hypothetical protein